MFKKILHGLFSFQSEVTVMWRNSKKKRLFAAIIVMVLVAAMIVTFVVSALMGSAG